MITINENKTLLRPHYKWLQRKLFTITTEIVLHKLRTTKTTETVKQAVFIPELLTSKNFKGFKIYDKKVQRLKRNLTLVTTWWLKNSKQ